MRAECPECGNWEYDLSNFETESLIQELAERRADSDYYIAESIPEKMKLELFLEVVDKISYDELKERLKII